MKKIVKTLSIMLAAIICATAFVGCGRNYAADYPDYSDSTTNFNLYAFYGPSEGTFAGGAPMGDGTDKRTKERYQEYKDAGFNVLLIENEAPYSGQEWSTSDTKKVMDICFEIGLDVIVHDSRLWSMAVSSTSLIGQKYNGIKIKTQDDVNAICAEFMKDYAFHPAFYGVYVMDEPSETQMPNCLMVVNGIKSVRSDAFVHLCLTTDVAGKFIADYQSKGWTDLVFDVYNAMFTLDIDGNVEPYVGTDYIRSLDELSGYASKYNLKVSSVTLQSFGMSSANPNTYNGAGGFGWGKPLDSEMRWAAYVSMAYAPDNLVWFYYWASRYSNLEGLDESCWINYNGEKTHVYEVGKQLNTEISKFGKVISHFDFKGAHYYTDADRLPKYYQVENEYEIEGITVSDLTGELLMTELYDGEKEVQGYMLVNSKDPRAKSTLTATVNFGDYKYAVVYKKGEPEIVKLKKGAYTFEIDCADGYFVLPY